MKADERTPAPQEATESDRSGRLLREQFPDWTEFERAAVLAAEAAILCIASDQPPSDREAAKAAELALILLRDPTVAPEAALGLLGLLKGRALGDWLDEVAPNPIERRLLVECLIAGQPPRAIAPDVGLTPEKAEHLLFHPETGVWSRLRVNRQLLARLRALAGLPSDPGPDGPPTPPESPSASPGAVPPLSTKFLDDVRQGRGQLAGAVARELSAHSLNPLIATDQQIEAALHEMLGRIVAHFVASKYAGNPLADLVCDQMNAVLFLQRDRIIAAEYYLSFVRTMAYHEMIALTRQRRRQAVIPLEASPEATDRAGSADVQAIAAEEDESITTRPGLARVLARMLLAPATWQPRRTEVLGPGLLGVIFAQLPRRRLLIDHLAATLPAKRRDAAILFHVAGYDQARVALHMGIGRPYVTKLLWNPDDGAWSKIVADPTIRTWLERIARDLPLPRKSPAPAPRLDLPRRRDWPLGTMLRESDRFVIKR